MEINEMADRLLTISWVVTIFVAVVSGYMLTIGYKPWNRRKTENAVLVLMFGYIVFMMCTMIIVFWLSSRQNSEGEKKLEPKSINQIKE